MVKSSLCIRTTLWKPVGEGFLISEVDGGAWSASCFITFIPMIKYKIISASVQCDLGSVNLCKNRFASAINKKQCQCRVQSNKQCIWKLEFAIPITCFNDSCYALLEFINVVYGTMDTKPGHQPICCCTMYLNRIDVQWTQVWCWRKQLQMEENRTNKNIHFAPLLSHGEE
jgi:hypothetical protein